MLPLFPQLGVIRLRAVISHLRDRPRHVSYIYLSLHFISLYMLLLFPWLGVIRLRAVVFHLRDRPINFLYSSLPLLAISPICLHSSFG